MVRVAALGADASVVPVAASRALLAGSGRREQRGSCASPTVRAGQRAGPLLGLSACWSPFTVGIPEAAPISVPARPPAFDALSAETRCLPLPAAAGGALLQLEPSVDVH